VNSPRIEVETLWVSTWKKKFSFGNTFHWVEGVSGVSLGGARTTAWWFHAGAILDCERPRSTNSNLHQSSNRFYKYIQACVDFNICNISMLYNISYPCYAVHSSPNPWWLLGPSLLSLVLICSKRKNIFSVHESFLVEIRPSQDIQEIIPKSTKTYDSNLCAVRQNIWSFRTKKMFVQVYTP